MLIPSVLVANRGEIARRVLRTCRRLGIRGIAVYSSADAGAPHVREADQALQIGPPPVAESYLNQDAILEAARRAGAQAIHPGYGFLSENADFAARCREAGLVWIGPSPEAMRALGDKARARALAERMGVPVLPGYHGEAQDPATLAERAAAIGYPLLIKASAGGGGRGMRVVDAADRLEEQLEAARREARAAFGDDRVLLERYVARPRHVEVQVFADTHGNAVHLGERECSIQRRHQKLIEESPSPAVDADLRARMGEAALTLVRAAGYTNAGTVELLLDADGRFYFLEVNARLQVEHPVTELVTGLDLVEWQLRVAAGEPLPLRQKEVRWRGHAVEARLIAEDPLAGFLPSTGSLERFDVPTPEGSRVDAGVETGSVVPAEYDSLLAKVLAWGEDREAAVARLRDTLAAASVEGVATNLDLLLAIAQDQAFQAGDLHTGYLAAPDAVARLLAVPAAAVAAATIVEQTAEPAPATAADPWRGPRPWRLAGMPRPSPWLAGGQAVDAEVALPPGEDVARVAVGDSAFAARLLGRGADGAARVDLGNTVAEVRLDASGAARVACDGRVFRLRRRLVLDPHAARPTGSAGEPDSLTAPMPGRVVKVAASAGQRVEAGQPLVVVEAMKMEHVVEAQRPAVVRQVLVEPGAQVQRGDILVELGDEA